MGWNKKKRNGKNEKNKHKRKQNVTNFAASSMKWIIFTGLLKALFTQYGIYVKVCKYVTQYKKCNLDLRATVWKREIFTMNN